MKKQTKNSVYTYATTLFSPIHPLITTIIIGLTLSTLHTKTASDSNYAQPIPVSSAAKKAATKKLLQAAQAGNMELAREAIQEQADIDATNSDGETALLCATSLNNIEMVRLLLEHNASTGLRKKRDASPLTIASREGYTNIVRLLLQHNANPNITAAKNTTALIYAANEGNTEIARLLIEHKANLNAEDLFDDTAIKRAICSDRTETARLLLEQGACMEKNIFIFLTFRNSTPDLIHLSLEHGADIDAQDHNGNTALIKSSIMHAPAIIETLILHGADVTITNNAKQSASTLAVPKLFEIIKKRKNLEKELGQQNWDLEFFSPIGILKQSFIPELASLVCAYADPYNTNEPLLLHAIKHYIRTNATPTRASRTTSAYTLCCAEAPDCSCTIKIKKTKKDDTCALQ